MNDFNKLKLPDDWAKGYESPITLALQEIANKITEERDDRIVAEISEQMGVNVDKHELARALAYDRDQYRKGFEAAWLTREKDVMTWIPIKMRAGTAEEYEEFSQYGDCPSEDFRVFECPLPDDEQKVLVTTRWGDVCVDIWHREVDCCYFEDNSDDDDVIAWMPLPEPYKKPEQLGGDENAEQ